jgi:hypothetical protein
VELSQHLDEFKRKIEYSELKLTAEWLSRV